MFVAMSFCLPIGAAIHAYHRRQQRRAAESEGSMPLLDGSQHGGEFTNFMCNTGQGRACLCCQHCSSMLLFLPNFRLGNYEY